MAVIKVRWSVEELANVMTQFDTQMVERSVDGDPPWVEITDSLTWVDLVAGQTDYYFDDTAGDPSYYYRTTFILRATPTFKSDPADPIQGQAGGFYVTVDDLRAEGLPATITDDRAVELINRAEALAETLTRNFFRQISGTFIFDGNNTHILHLPLPIVSITSLKVNDDTTALSTDYYQVWNGRQKPQDDRRNPKIVLKRSNGSSIFTSGYTSNLFLKGTNQTIEGIFGYLEPDGSVPLPLKEAVMGIALLEASKGTLYASLAGMDGVVGAKIRERTDDHELQWSDAGKQAGRAILPPSIWNKLMMFQAPRKMAIPTVRWSEIRP